MTFYYIVNCYMCNRPQMFAISGRAAGATHKCTDCGSRLRISSSQIIHHTTQSKEAVEKLKELRVEGDRLAAECRNSTRLV